MSAAESVRPARDRLAIIGVSALIIQTAVISQVPPFSGSADIVLLTAMSVGLLFGSLPGAVFGFCVGLGADLLLVQALGQYALLYMAVGYGAGRVFELRNPSGLLILMPLGAAAAAFVQIGFGLLQVLLGGGATLSLVVINQGALAVIWGSLLAVPVHLAVRRVTKQSTRRPGSGSSRRRAYATGGLSPLTPGKKR